MENKEYPGVVKQQMLDGSPYYTPLTPNQGQPGTNQAQSGMDQAQGQPWMNQPQSQPWMYQGMPVSAMEPKHHNAVQWVLIAIGGILILLFFMLIGIAFLKLVMGEESPASGSGKATESKDVESDFWKKEDYIKKSEQDSAEEYEWDEDGVYGITPDADYYAGLTDSINTTTDYQIRWEDYNFEDHDTAAEIRVTYPQIVGDTIPNLEHLNESLHTFSVSIMDFYTDFYLQNRQEEDYLDASAEAFITYNDDSTASIVISQEITMTDAYHRYLCSLNVDLINGVIDWNTQMLDIDDDFLKEFRKQIAVQNNWNMEFSDQELYEYLNDENTLILYYTPVGLEIGINYVDEYNEVSWVTATIKEYHKYSKSIG